MPALSKSREAVRTAQCLSNQRQLNVAMLSYVDASKDFIAPWCYNDAFGYYAMDIYMTGYLNTGVTVYKGRRLAGIQRHSDVYTITDTEIWHDDFIWG